MPRPFLVILLAACSGSAPVQPAPPAPPPPTAPALAARGQACSREAGCAAGLLCGPLPGGYCASFCGDVGTACDGACVETGTAGEMCLAKCTSDDQCRKAEGYVCDPQWKACMLPGLAAIVPKQCPAVAGPARDAAFGAVAQLSTDKAPGMYQFEPAAVLTAEGGVAAMFITRGALTEGNKLGTATIDGKGVVAPDGVLGTAHQSHFDPWLARDGKGKLYAVWYGFDGRDANGEIAMATSADHGATWGKPAIVHDPADCKGGEGEGCLDKPMIAIGPHPKGGEAVYVIYSAEEGGLRVRASRDGGATFSPGATALEGIYGNPAIGADGKLHLVTLNGGPRLGAFGSPEQKVEYAVSADGGGTFAKPVVVSAPGEVLPFFFSNPSVVVDDKRKWLYVAYARGGRDAVWDIAIAASKDGGKTWTRTAIGDGCAIHMVPNLALDPTTGTLHVAWYDSSGAVGRFAHATCAPGAASCVQRGAINDAPFAALSTERHGGKWIGEYESLFVDDKRRVLHAVLTQPVHDHGKILARIFHAAAKL